ncbi:MAG: Coq4 family protein [Aulosira sp. ZfuVER01]|nr:Coq4 family protein [Aulosira sp. ZfuVER01]MDZ8000456.1 Coq4 family protein [Aulosira sp. DedVER01a]MDZ8052928.1 Coq4 family protein [Aulosira sp. ZfuCHP01]
MVKKWQQLQAMLAAKNSGNLGDFAILKSDFLGAKVAPEVADKLRSLEGYYPLIDLEKLSQYALGSFGREYAEHMKVNNLKPLTISPELDEIAKRNVFALRYVVTHDIFHVLLGFDTSYAGEIGVLAFATAQNYSNSFKISLLLAKFLYPLLAPRQIKAIFANLQKGCELGNKAEFLLGYRFEDHWQEPINDVRKHLGLPQISLISHQDYVKT